MTVKLASKKRSTQFFAHDSSPLSRVLLRIVPVMHFLKQMSVRVWTAMGKKHLVSKIVRWLFLACKEGSRIEVICCWKDTFYDATGN
jgi:hypothetical protein